MLVNMNTNQSSRPSFGMIKLYGGSEDVLKKVLKSGEWLEFSKIIEQQKLNTTTDAIFFAKGKKKLYGRVVSRDLSHSYMKNYEQHFWESTMSFIKKIVSKSEKAKQELETEPKVDVDEILKNARDIFN